MLSIHEGPIAGKTNPIVAITVEFGDGARRTFRGRDAWALSELIDSGLVGVTPIERPAPRIATVFRVVRREVGAAR
jgi:hypothetical protein